METDNKNLLKESETTIGLKALAYKNLFFDNKDFNCQINIDNPNEKTVIDKNKCKRNLLLVAALSVGYVLLANYDYYKQKIYY
jgi:hypothetical protein